MERESAKRLITACWIVTMMYLGPLVVFQFVGHAVRPSSSLDPQTLGVLAAVLAVYGLVLTLLGAPRWGAMFYVACALHGFHLMVRWPRYGRAVRDTPH